MAASLNRVTLVGNLGKDPEVKQLQSGRTVANFSLATHESWTDDSKQKKTRTDWHAVEVWGAAAKLVGEYLAKGRLVLVEGALRTDKYEKAGQTHWMTKIVARNVQFLDRPEKAEPLTGEEPPDAPAPSDAPPF